MKQDLEQRFPAGGSWTPGFRNAIFEGERLFVSECNFFERTEICESLQVQLRKRRISNLVIPANVLI